MKPYPVKRTLLSVWFLLWMSSAAAPSGAQSLTGVRGLVTIPTAEMAADGALTVGVNMLNRGSMDYHGGLDHARSPYATLAYLPFLEMGLRLTRADSPVEEALGDRTVSLRVLLRKDRGAAPGLLVGIHDFLGAKRYFQSTYAVASKTLRGLPVLDHVSLHLGYGARLIDAELYDFDGVFGGVAIAPTAGFRLMADYDARNVNVGADLRLFDRLHAIVGVSDFRAVSAGVSYGFALGR